MTPATKQEGHETASKKEHDGRVIQLLRPMLARTIEARGRSADTTKTEVILNRCGLSHKEISLVLEKKEGAIRMALQRAK